MCRRSTFTYNVNHHVLAKRVLPLGRKVEHSNHFFRMIAIDVEDGRPEYLGRGVEV